LRLLFALPLCIAIRNAGIAKQFAVIVAVVDLIVTRCFAIRARNAIIAKHLTLPHLRAAPLNESEPIGSAAPQSASFANVIL